MGVQLAVTGADELTDGWMDAACSHHRLDEFVTEVKRYRTVRCDIFPALCVVLADEFIR